jgi:hypothetical protein
MDADDVRRRAENRRAFLHAAYEACHGNTMQPAEIQQIGAAVGLTRDESITLEHELRQDVNARRIREHVIVENESTLVGCQSA